jgi:hypothetical protein
MVSNCANPSCSAIFRYLHEGTIFQVATRTPTDGKRLGGNGLDRFWLCGECSKTMTIISQPTGIRVTSLAELSDKHERQRNRGVAIGHAAKSS